jgi:imidazolonepropionase-like amidohydrolase
MRKILASLLLLFVVSLPVFSQQKPPARQTVLALVHVTVIDMTGAPVKVDMTVIIATGRIRAIGKASQLRIPKDSQVINASGKF